MTTVFFCRALCGETPAVSTHCPYSNEWQVCVGQSVWNMSTDITPVCVQRYIFPESTDDYTGWFLIYTLLSFEFLSSVSLRGYRQIGVHEAQTSSPSLPPLLTLFVKTRRSPVSTTYSFKLSRKDNWEWPWFTPPHSTQTAPPLNHTNTQKHLLPLSFKKLSLYSQESFH